MDAVVGEVELIRPGLAGVEAVAALGTRQAIEVVVDEALSGVPVIRRSRPPRLANNGLLKSSGGLVLPPGQKSIRARLGAGVR